MPSAGLSEDWRLQGWWAWSGVPGRSGAWVRAAAMVEVRWKEMCGA